MAWAGVLSSLAFAPECGRWQDWQPSALAIGLCWNRGVWAIALWQRKQSCGPAARSSFGPLAACGSWHERQSPFRSGAWTTLPAAMVARSWQLSQSLPPVAVRANGLAEFAGAWQASHDPEATGSCTDVRSSFAPWAEW